MASQPTSRSGKHQNPWHWHRLERLNTPSPILPLGDDLDDVAGESLSPVELPLESGGPTPPEFEAELDGLGEVESPAPVDADLGEVIAPTDLEDGSGVDPVDPEAGTDLSEEPPVADLESEVEADLEDPHVLGEEDFEDEILEFVSAADEPSDAELPVDGAAEGDGVIADSSTDTDLADGSSLDGTDLSPGAEPDPTPEADIEGDGADPGADESDAIETTLADEPPVDAGEPEELEGTLTEETPGDDGVADEGDDPSVPPIDLDGLETPFESGIYTVGESGLVAIDVLWDGGAYEGQAGLFSLRDLETYEPGSAEFIEEAVRRVLSDSVLGRMFWDDTTEAARFDGVMGGGRDHNSGVYGGVKIFEMEAGDKFGIVMIPNSTFAYVFENPTAGGAARPLFSMVTANPNESFQMGQIADVTGDGSVFAFEDKRIDRGSDRDYNDFIFQVRGATGDAVLMDEVVAANKDWRGTDAGQLLLSYTQQYLDVSVDGGDLATETPEDGVLPETSGFVGESSSSEFTAGGSSQQLETAFSSVSPTHAKQPFTFFPENQPVIGIVDRTFTGDSPVTGSGNIIWRIEHGGINVGNIDSPTPDDGGNHVIHGLDAITAQPDNNLEIGKINSDAPIFVAEVPEGSSWSEALIATVDHIKTVDQPNGVVSLNLDLTRQGTNGTFAPRFELTAQEWEALAYANKNGVVIVIPASSAEGIMPVLEQITQEFDNILTVGSAERTNNFLEAYKAYEATDDSGGGFALDLVADAHRGSLSGVKVAAANAVSGAYQVWAANPELNHTQVLDILTRTATDLGVPGWDAQTGSGLLNIAAAIHLAKITEPKPYTVKPGQRTITDQFISHNPDAKTLPGDPIHPATAVPGIAATKVDTGSNRLDEATQLRMSPSVDIIDQVSSLDPVDFFRTEGRYINGADFSVLDGELSIRYLTPSGQLLGAQVLGKGSHKLSVPGNISDEVVLRIERRNQNPATYMLYGFESSDPQPFNIDLTFDSPLTSTQRQILEAAAKNVAGLIAQGLPTAIVDGKIIDDINIKVSGANLDGAGGIQARTKIDFMRYGSLLPAQSLVQFDAADIADLEKSGSLFDVAQHEFLHALGFGNLWEAKGLINYAGTSLAQYNGRNAVDAFQAAGGLTDAIALEMEGSGSASLHWHQQLFPDEIMTADLNGFTGERAPISAVTIASLADLGYAVNLDRATPGYQVLGGQSFNGEDLTPEQVEAFRQLAEMSLDESDADYEYVAPIMPTTDPETMAPEIWAHAERFWKNGEYYDWRRYQVQWGDTLSQIALDTMGSAHPDNYWWIANRNGIPNPDWIYKYDWIDIPVHRPNYEWEQEQERLRREAELRQRQEEEARRRREQEEAFAREQERVRQEEEARRREAEARQRELEEQERRLRAEMERRRQEEERRLEEARLAELARQAEIARQQGKGGLDWYIAKPLPEFGPVDPFETRLTGETVGNLVPDDYYRFTLSRGGRITAELQQLLADADLVLYDVRNRPIAYSMREGITDEQIIADLIPGTYMLRVNSPQGVTTDYELIVKFKHLLSRTEQGPPPGWRVGGGSSGGGGAAGPLFSDPRIQRIYDTALNNFAGPERAKANARIAELEREKRSYEQEMKALLDKMNAEQRAKVNKALDDARHNANVWVDNIANPIKSTVDGLADGIINKANSIANNLNGAADWLPSWPWDVKGEAKKKIREAKDAVTSAVNNARGWLKGELGKIQDAVKSAVWHFFEAIKNAYRTGAEINQAIASAANSFRSAVDSAVRGANELVGKFKGRVLSAVDWTKNLGISAFGFNFNAYNQLVKPAVDAIASGVSSTINGIGNGLKDITNWLEPRTQKAVADIVNALLGDQTGHLWNKINGVDAKIAATRTEVEQKIANKAREFQSQLNDFLNKLGSDGKKLLDTLLNFSNSPTAQIGMAVIEVILGLIPGVGQAIDIKDTAISLHDILIQGKQGVADFVGLIGALAGWVPGVGDAIKSVAKIAIKGADFLVPLLKNLGPDVTETVIKTASELDWGKVLMDVVNTIVRRWDDILRVLNGSAGWILDLLGAKPVMATASGVMVSFKKGAENISGSVNQSKKYLVEPLEDAASQIKKKVRLIVGDSTKLGNNLKFDEAFIPGTSIKYPGLRGDYQAHHLIPSAVADDSEFMLNAVQYGNFDIDAAVNGIFLPNDEWKAVEVFDLTGQSLPIHLGSHPVYSNRISQALNTEWNLLKATGKTTDPASLNAAVSKVIESAKKEYLPLITKPYKEIPD